MYPRNKKNIQSVEWVTLDNLTKKSSETYPTRATFKKNLSK